MDRNHLIVASMLLLSGCGEGVNLYASTDREAYSRTFVRFTDAEDTDKVLFEVKKRPREVIAEKTLYKDEKNDVALSGGKHKDKNWSLGLMWHYHF